jgi:hypothetical protein
MRERANSLARFGQLAGAVKVSGAMEKIVFRLSQTKKLKTRYICVLFTAPFVM